MLLGSSRPYNLCFNNYTQKNVTIPLDTPFVYEDLQSLEKLQIWAQHVKIELITRTQMWACNTRHLDICVYNNH
jgi:hypothetical protein